MTRPAIKQPMPPIGEPLVIMPDGTPLYMTEIWRRNAENENYALFGGDGSEDVTQALPSGVPVLGTDTNGNYVESISSGLNISITSGTPAEGGTPTIATIANPIFSGITCNGNVLVSGTVDGRDVATDGTKLDGIDTGATANDTDANLKARANHTGSQAISTITNLQTELDGKVSKTTSITDAETAHSLNATFDNTEVESALNDLGTKMNEIIERLNL